MNRLNYRHLQYFWVVAKEGNLTRAAGQLHVSQSALSAQIRQLEAQLGQALFERDGRGLRLTETGQLTLGYAESIFGLGNELVSLLASEQGQRLRVGSVATLSRNFQENFLRPVLDTPRVQLVLESDSLEALLARLAVHELDVILSNRAVSGDARQRLSCRALARQSVSLVGPPQPQGSRFTFPDSLRERDVLLPGPRSDIRARFDIECERLGVRPRVRAEVDDMAMLRLLARDAGAVALLPTVVVQDELHHGLLQQYCLVPGVEETFYAITAARRVHPPILDQLLEQSTEAMLRR